MSHNTFGKLFRFTTWGESHGVAIGCVIDGCPPMIPLNENDIQKYLDMRKPHTAVNFGEQDRYHLIIDIKSDQRFN